MGQRKDIDGSASVPTFYGKELRWKREEAGLTLQQLVEGSFYGPSHLSEIERGERRMPAELAEHVDQALGTDGFFRRRCEDVRRAKRRGHASYFERVLEAEKHAEAIEEWCPTLIPGLLQTDAYARAVVRATHPLAPDEEVEEKVSARSSPSRYCASRSFRRSRQPNSWSGSRRWPGAAGSFHRSFRGTAERIPSCWAQPRS